MSSRRRAHLDALERALTGPKRIALFGHRAVGKTTLLAMFYREASSGRVPDVRLAAARPSTAEYLAERIAQIESGEPLPATLAETELHLRLYRGAARFDLIVKDYQGEHVGLGSEAPIREFFADCDAVLLCLDPEGSAMPAERRRRQQEVEELLERYIEASEDGTAGRPVALVVTKYDHVIATGGPPPDEVERLVDERFGMTAHALDRHATRSAVFAVSAYGLGAVDDRPPADLHPLGLGGPLLWLAEALESVDRERLEWLWDLAPDDRARLSRCVAAFERRYPQSDRLIEYRRRLRALRARGLKRAALGVGALALTVAAALAGYDLIGYRSALLYERDRPATLVETRWREFLAWHPTLKVFWPSQARAASKKVDEWTVKAAAQRVAVGTTPPNLAETMGRLKDEAPELAPDIREVERAAALRLHNEVWERIRADDLADADQPDKRASAYRAFLRDNPDSPHRAEALEQVARWDRAIADIRTRAERREVDALERELALPDADLTAVVEKARDFLARHSDSAWRDDVDRIVNDAVRRIDENDIQKARDFSRQFPTNFPTRLRKYQEYLNTHREGGQFVREALDAVDALERERDLYAYRQAYDHAATHPNDVAEIARRLRTYLETSPQGRFTGPARDYLAWWDRVSAPGTYRVTVKNGAVEPDTSKYLSGGGPDLAVEIWVAGVKYGPTPVAPNTLDPIWNYTFPQPIKWKYGDPVVIRILDFDWSTAGTGVFKLSSPKDDPLAMRFLSGEVKPARGGRTKLMFESDFRIPTLPKPDAAG
jgi:hypothetical protein